MLCLLLAAAYPVARADSSGSEAPHTLDELRQMREEIDTRHTRRLQEIQNGLELQSYDGDTALTLRMNENRQYKEHLDSLETQEQQTYRTLEAQQLRSGSAAHRAPSSSSGPKIQWQPVINFPGDSSSPSPDEKPSREGSQKNVAPGIRELEF